MKLDPTTQANYTQIASEHIHFEWTVDFEKKKIFGSATHTLDVKEDDLKEVMYVYSFSRTEQRLISHSCSFDTSALDIERVEINEQPAKAS